MPLASLVALSPAYHTNDTYSGLINATVGNASELIFCLVALEDKMYRVVQLSLLGSVVSNLLLVLGCACLLGGSRHETQHFSTRSGSVTSASLLMAAR